MKVLLSDGAGLTSRQVATILGRAGHHVEVLDAAGFALTHATRWVRLVEPVNALRSGVDLVGALLGITLGETVPAAPTPRPGVRTHQLMLALTKAATTGGRGAVVRELTQAATGTGPYRNSTEELTPARGDLRTALLATAVGGGLLVRPRLAGRLTGGAVASYSLTPTAWRELLEARDNRGLTWR